MSEINLQALTTEHRNSKTTLLDTLSIHEIVTLMNEEDATVALSIRKELPSIEKVIEVIVERLTIGGRVVYIGAGTSGRLGVIDASECPPTFSTTDEFMGIIAGGDSALRKAQEGAEDSTTLAREDLIKLGLRKNDVLIGIAASGRTPYCIGGFTYAKEIGVTTVAITCNKNSEMAKYTDLAIEVEVGPEILTGSTRLKAGTAQKLVLNMISTVSMIRMGKVFGNLMVDVKPSNAKLVVRAHKIICEATGCELDVAQKTLEESHQQVKPAITMILCGCSYDEAIEKLASAKGRIREVIR